MICSGSGGEAFARQIDLLALGTDLNHDGCVPGLGDLSRQRAKPQGRIQEKKTLEI